MELGLTVGLVSGAVVAPSLGALLMLTGGGGGGETEVCREVGGGDEIGVGGVLGEGAGGGLLGVTLRASKIDES